mmetsp:Transcript_16083/g.44275  ORF Transcript_16083/g.44275 Transcript_16083/m.44275 type:complete len:205 (+) Transcript_16083:174-788(+)
MLMKIQWKPYMIDPNTEKGGEEYTAYNRRRWGSDGWTHHLRSEGRGVGANFANWKWWPHTMKAHQMVCFFEERDGVQDNNDDDQGEDITSRCNQALFQALYEEGQNLSNIDTLVNSVAVAKLGLSSNDTNTLRQYLQQDQAASRVKREIAQAQQQYRISGVPFFIIGYQNPEQQEQSTPYGFSGAQSPETFLEIFRELSEGADD